MDHLAVSNSKDMKALEQELWSAFDRGDSAAALRFAQRLGREFPRFASGWYSISQLAYQLKNYQLAQQAIGNALKLEPHSAVYQLQAANMQGAQGNLAAVRERMSNLELQQLKTRYQLETAARLLVAVDEHLEALNLYRQVIASGEADAQAYFNVATVCRFIGKLDEARQMLTACLALAPKHTAARLLDAGLRTKSSDDNQVELLSQLVVDYELTPRQRVEAGYALAKELEDLGRYGLSFERLSDAAMLRRQHINYDLEADLATLSALCQSSVDTRWQPAEDRWAGEGAMFVLGLPRSGTTLVDRVLSAHSEIVSLGEPNAFPMALNSLLLKATHSSKLSRQEAVNTADKLDKTELARSYLSAVNALRGDSSRFIDKLPMNYLNIGLIVSALPNAKVVLLERAPLDVIYAIYKNLFEDAYPFSYDLIELTRYYIGYRKLMRYWLIQAGDRIHTVSYETLVSQPEETIRSLADYCELNFEERMLAPESNQAASTTASAAQVRQSIYRSSVEKWRHVATELAPVIKLLEDEGINPYQY